LPKIVKQIIRKYIVHLIVQPLTEMKISLLIPVYNYDIIELVHSMKSAIGKVPELIEILIGDDGSSPEFTEKYRTLESENVKVITSEKNIGRAAIRNKLALEANGDFLLFLDADVILPGTAEAYILKWIPYINSSRVICGGTLYHDSPPGDPDKLLRWKYGKWREQVKASERNKHPHAGFSTFNVMIEKSVFSKIRFNEELKQYGHEDTLLGYQLKKAGIGILHIDNGLIHEGVESNREYLNKTKLGIENLSKLYDKVTDKKSFSETVRILKAYNKLRFLGLTRIMAAIYIRCRDRMEIRLDSNKISLILFGFYKMTMFCTYREIHNRKKTLPVI
jgi:glycosyltransferase involved in cell wall biosynthesis